MTCLRAPRDLDEIACRRPVNASLRLVWRIERGAVLVQGRHGETGAALHFARVGREATGQKIDQRRLSGAIGADEAQPVANAGCAP